MREGNIFCHADQIAVSPLIGLLKRRLCSKMNRWLTALGGFFVGIVNSLLGAGGGMLAVPLLQKSNLTQTQAHASSIAVIFPLSLLSSVLYVTSGKVALMQAVPYFPVAVIGAIAGYSASPAHSCKMAAPDFRNLYALGWYQDGDEMNWIDQIAGLFSAVAGALGLGGGGVLVLYLTLGMHMPQLRAQGINLLFFCPARSYLS